MNYNKADFIASYGISSQLPESDRPELSFSGRSNVGKSSLINKLCSRKNLARVSSTPGKTATINFYSVDDCYFVDLPGYGYAKVSNADRERWDDLINSYFEAPRHHTLLVQLLDCRHAPSADDEQMLRYLHYHQIPYVVALTKADKLKKSQLAKTQEDFENLCRPYGCQKVVLTSGENGYGIPELQAVLNAAIAASQRKCSALCGTRPNSWAFPAGCCFCGRICSSWTCTAPSGAQCPPLTPSTTSRIWTRPLPTQASLWKKAACSSLI